ncbi:hypothetical protein DB29_01527 [Shouchella clausii]|nr:hypothetical protein DB29_01527 [Shouchella clausii]
MLRFFLRTQLVSNSSLIILFVASSFYFVSNKRKRHLAPSENELGKSMCGHTGIN